MDGEVKGSLMSCDLVDCSNPRFVSDSGEYVWNSLIYERKGEVESCLFPETNETLNRTMPSFESSNASPGIYMVKFGNAQTIFEIR